MKPDTCKVCPLYASGKGFVVPEIPKNVRLLVQGEAPGNDEVAAGRPFVGAAGRWLRMILRNAGVDDEDVLFDNTIRCLNYGKIDGYPTGKVRKEAELACRQYDKWSDFPHTPLLLTGAKAINQWMADDKVSKWHGHVEARGERLIGCTYHPSAVMRAPNLLPLVIQEVKNLIKVTQQPHLLERPNVNKGWIFDEEKDYVFDLEWNIENSKIICVGRAYDGQRAYSSYEPNEITNLIYKIKNERFLAIGHNVVWADLPILGFTPEQIRDLPNVYDTMLVAHLVHPHFAKLGLLSLEDMVKYYEPIGNWKEDKQDLLEYNGRDCAYNYRLYQHLARDLKYTKQEHIYKHQQELAALTVAMKQQGVALDVDSLMQYAQEQKLERTQMAASFPFNPNSHKQIKKWMGEQGVKVANAQFETLKKHEGKLDIIDNLIEYRENNKALKTWFPFEEDDDGNLSLTEKRVFSSFHATGTDVARTSSSGPDVQNIPAGGDRLMPGGYLKDMPNLRKFFTTSGTEFEFVSFDYSQLEDWTIAYLSGDKQLMEDLKNGIDIHSVTAAAYVSMVTGRSILPSEITKKSPERFKGKTTNHSAKYLITPHTLAKRMYGTAGKKEVNETTQLLSAYFHRYRGVSDLHNRLANQFERGDTSVRNPFGRYRRLYAHEANYKWSKPFYSRLVTAHHEKVKMGTHFLGCSTGAEIVNRAGVTIWKELGIVPLMLIHDEWCFELPRGEEGMRQKRLIKEIMQAPILELEGLQIPVNCSVGTNYGDLKEVQL